MTVNNKSERNYRGKCLGWPVTSYGAVTIKNAAGVTSGPVVIFYGVTSVVGEVLSFGYFSINIKS